MEGSVLDCGGKRQRDDAFARTKHVEKSNGPGALESVVAAALRRRTPKAPRKPIRSDVVSFASPGSEGDVSDVVRKTIVIFLALVSAISAVIWSCSHRGTVELSVCFIGYTHSSLGPHAAVIQVSNASPFAVVRGRSSVITFDSPGVSDEYPPTGWNLLQPMECERIVTEPILGGMRWKLTVIGQPLGHEDYGISSEGWSKRVVRWLQDHRVPIPDPSPNACPHFSSNWIEP